MKRVVVAAMIACGVVTGSLGGGCTPAAELSAAEIVTKNVAARGGVEAWRKVETMAWSGHIESARASMPGARFELEQKRPNKTRLQIHALGDTFVRVFDGERGWKLRPGRGRSLGRMEAQPYTPEESRFAQAGHGIDGPLVDHAAQGHSVAKEGVEEIGGRQAYHLKVRLAQGGDEDVWVDTETFLEVRCDRPADASLGAPPRRVSMMFGDWRTVQGLKIPFLISTGSEPGTTPDKMQIESVVLNPPLDDSTFANPAVPQMRNRMRSDFAGRAPGRRAAPPALPSWALPRTASAEREARGPVPVPQ